MEPHWKTATVPIYEYACRRCEHEFETLQKISEPPLVDCPVCGAAELRKKVSAARFRLKGGGWYETDFKSGDKKNVVGDGSRDSRESKEAGKESSSADSNGEKASSAASGDAKTSNGKGAKAADGASTASG